MGRVISGLIFTLEALFALGVAGSSLVLILTLIEDSKELFMKDRSPADLMGSSSSVQVQPTLPR